MKKQNLLAAALAVVALGAGFAPAAQAAPAQAPGSADATVAAQEKLQGVRGSRLVFRNDTDKTLMLYAPDQGITENTHEHYMGTLQPGQEYTASGYVDKNYAFDVYLRVFTVKKSSDGTLVRDTMVATVGAHNPWMGRPRLHATAGTHWSNGREFANKATKELSEHETHDSWQVDGGNKFRAWIHRDGDVDGDSYKTMKITVRDIDTTPTKDFTGGGAAPA